MIVIFWSLYTELFISPTSKATTKRAKKYRAHKFGKKKLVTLLEKTYKRVLNYFALKFEIWYTFTLILMVKYV